MTATNYAVAPGEYLQEWIDEQGVPPQQVADRLGCSREQLAAIVAGHVPLTGDSATRLEYLTGIPAEAWLRYEAAYRADIARLRLSERNQP